MIRVLRRNGFLLCGLPILTPQENPEEFEQYKLARGLYITDPWERVKSIFSKDDHDERHPDLKEAFSMFNVGFWVGALYGGLSVTARKAESYIHRNDSNIYHDHRKAMADFVSHNTKSFLTASCKAAIPFALFFGGFSLINSCCEAYSNKPRIIHSSAAGFIVGSLNRFMYGIKGMISGGVVGGVLGTIYGVSCWGMRKLTNTDHLELKYAQFAFRKYREQWHTNPRAIINNENVTIDKLPLPSEDVPTSKNQSDNKENVPTLINKSVDTENKAIK